MDPVKGKYINLLQQDSDRKEWAEFISKIEKLKYKKGEDFISNNTGNPSAYFKADVANNAKVKALRDKYNVTGFGIEGIDQSNIIGQIISGAKVFLKEEKEICTIGVGHKNEYGHPVIKADGSTIRRSMHEFVVLNQNSDLEQLRKDPYAMRLESKEVEQPVVKETKKSLDESLEELFKKPL